MNEDNRECCETYPGTEHDEHCPSPRWPTGDATPERFNLVVNEDRSVTVFDGETPIEHFRGVDALADALDRRMKLTAAADAGIELTPAAVIHLMSDGFGTTRCCFRTPFELPRGECVTENPDEVTCGIIPPGKFLAETLPAYARTQRLEAMLADVRTAEASALAGLTEAITLLNRAVSLRERLEKALEAASRPLSATEKPEQAAEVHWVTRTPTARTTGYADGRFVMDFNSNPGSTLSRPQQASAVLGVHRPTGGLRSWLYDPLRLEE